MAELEPREGSSGTEDMVGDDDGEAVLLFDEDEDGGPMSVRFGFCGLALLDDAKMALNMVVATWEVQAPKGSSSRAAAVQSTLR